MGIVEGKSFDESLVMTQEEEKVWDSVIELHNEFAKLIARVEDEIPSSRERSLVLTKLQEADLWMGMVPLS